MSSWLAATRNLPMSSAIALNGQVWLVEFVCRYFGLSCRKKKSISKLAQFFIIKYRRWTYSAEANSEIRGIEKLSCRHFVLFSFFSALPLTKCLLDLASQGPARQTAVFVFSRKFQRRGMRKDWHIRKNVKSSQSTAKISMIDNQS